MKKGFSIVFTSTDSSVSRHIFLSKKLFITVSILFFIVMTFLVFGLIKYGTLSYRMIELELLKRRLTEMEKEFSKLEAIKKKLELSEAENQRIKNMLGIEKTPSPVSPVMNKVESNFEKNLSEEESVENLPSLLPVIGQISKKFDETHKGIDIAAPSYSPIIAAGSGKVVSVGWDTLYGNYVIIEHSVNYKTFYGHLHSILVKYGDIVTGGKIIGLLGSTGKSTSPHLHYEVIFKGQPVDPMAYLPAKVEKKGGL
ncbi:MAG: peptidoglycan DD-metalloendopeptidase family protein [candidate division WOR-3 bacterium]